MKCLRSIFIKTFQQPPYNNDESWLETHLLPEIKNSDRKAVFISIDEDLYDGHKNIIKTYS